MMEEKASGFHKTLKINVDLRSSAVRILFFALAGMEKLRKGGSPVITLGEDKGGIIELDHILPLALVPKLGLAPAIYPGIADRRRRIAPRRRAIVSRRIDSHRAGKQSPDHRAGSCRKIGLAAPPANPLAFRY